MCLTREVIYTHVGVDSSYQFSSKGEVTRDSYVHNGRGLLSGTLEDVEGVTPIFLAPERRRVDGVLVSVDRTSLPPTVYTHPGPLRLVGNGSFCLSVYVGWDPGDKRKKDGS